LCWTVLIILYLNAIVYALYIGMLFSDVVVTSGRIRAREPPQALKMEMLH
jgi:hypothetical protein